MARHLRIQYPGAIYHVMARGQGRGDIFHDDHGRRCFLEKLEEVVSDDGLRLYAYVLMSNHYHLLVCTPRGNLSKAMQRLQSSYSTWFRVRHHVSGHVFGGRFKAPLVDGDAYLLGVSRYIHLNPVCIAALAKQPLRERRSALRAYRWSSYPGYVNVTRRVSWVIYEPLLAMLPGSATARYARYAEDGLMHPDEELDAAMKASSKAIGSEGFRQWAEQEHRTYLEGISHPEDVAMRRQETGLDPERVMTQVLAAYDLTLLPRGQSEARDVLLVSLRTRCGLTNRDIGRRLGHKDGATVGKRWKILRSNRNELKRLQACCDRMVTGQ